MKELCEKWFMLIDKFFIYFSALLLLLMTGLICIQVLFRYVINQPLAWSEELSRFIFVWVTFSGAYLGSRKGQHISVALIQDMFPFMIKKTMVALSMLITAGFFAIAAYYCAIQWTKLGTQFSPALHLPMNWIYFGMILGCVFLAVSYLWQAVCAIIDKGVAK